MLIEFNKKSNFYDDLENQLYGSDMINSILYNFTPVKILGECFIMTSLKNLEGYLLDYRENITIKLYIGETVRFIKLNSIISFTEKNYNPSNKYDCYIDSISNLILIRYTCDDFAYVDIYNYLDPHKDLLDREQNILVTYIWTDNFLKNYNITKKTKLNYVWDPKYINLPEIPYIVDTANINEKMIPITGSAVLDSNGLLGMVSYINQTQIIITPLITIKKLAKYLEGEFILSLGLELFPIQFNFLSEFNKINFDNGLLIRNNFYNIDYKNYKSKKSNNVINNSISNKNINKSNNYNQFVDIFNKTNIDSENNKLDKSVDEHLIYEKKKILIDIVKSFVDDDKNNKLDKLDKFDKIDELDEFDKLDESLIDSSIKTIILNRENKKYLSKKNILCSIDNYKIDKNGNIIIDGEKNIPFNSYIWLFKSIDNNILNLSLIPNYIYNINLIELNNGSITLTDSYIKKKLEIKETKIYLDTSYEKISSFNSSEIKYIKYKNKLICELNEKILFTMKNCIIKKQNLYQKIFSKIFSNRYNHDGSKLIVGINFDYEYPKISIINNHTNFESIKEKYKTNKELKRFIMNYI